MKRIGKLLVIPDAHASPAYDNSRFDALGAFIAAERPDVIVCLGDWACMPSLSSYDKGKRAFEGRRYKADCESSVNALERLEAPLRRLAYKPKKFVTLGNHEARISKATNEHPELHGTISVADVGFEAHGWEVTPYREVLTLAGWSFSHEVANGVMGRPCSSPQVLVKMAMMSTFVGHKHTLEEHTATRLDGSKVTGVIAGCFTHLGAKEDWNRNTAHLAWNGVHLLTDVADGGCGEMRRVTQKQLRKVYL